MMNTEYILQKQDIIWLDFDPSAGRKIQKRRSAVVVSRDSYAKQTGLIVVCPITHGQERLKELGLLIPVLSRKIDGYVNPLQLHTFDFRKRNAQKVDTVDTMFFQKVVQLYNYIFSE